MDFDATQAIALSDYDDETDDEVLEEEKKPVAHLKVQAQTGFPETIYPIFEGVTLIGRDASTCNLHMPVKALSKQHACIEVMGQNHLLYDKNSRNKTRKGKLYLAPEVRYSLQDGEDLTFADLKCSYIYAKKEQVLGGDETDSELGGTPADAKPPESNNNSAAAHQQTLGYELDEDEDEDDDEPSSDILQPTQAYDPQGHGLLGTRVQLGEATQLYAAESDDESEEIPVEKPFEVIEAETPGTSKKKGVIFGQTQYIPESDESDEETEPTSQGGEKKIVLEEATMAYDLDVDDDATDDEDAADVPTMAAVEADVATQAYILEEEDEETAEAIKVKRSSPSKRTQRRSMSPGPAADTATMAYDMDVEPTQTDDEIVQERKQEDIDVVPDSDSEMATQTFDASKDGDTTATQTFTDDAPEGSNPVINLGAGTLEFDYDSDQDESLIMQKPFSKVSEEDQPTQVIGDEMDGAGEGSTVPDTQAATQVMGDTDATQSIPQQAENDATQVLDQADTLERKSAAEDDPTQVIGDLDEGDAATQIFAAEVPTMVVEETPLVQKTKPRRGNLSPIATGDEQTLDLDATQVFGDVDSTMLLDKSGRSGKQNLADATQILDETKDEGDDIPTLYISTSTMAGDDNTPPRPSRNLDATQLLDATQVLDDYTNTGTPVLIVPCANAQRTPKNTSNLDSTQLLDETQVIDDNVDAATPNLVVPQAAAIKDGSKSPVMGIVGRNSTQEMDETLILNEANSLKKPAKKRGRPALKKQAPPGIDETLEFSPPYVSTQIDEEPSSCLKSPELTQGSPRPKEEDAVDNFKIPVVPAPAQPKRGRPSKAAAAASPTKASPQKADTAGDDVDTQAYVEDDDDMACTQAYGDQAEDGNIPATSGDDIACTQAYTDSPQKSSIQKSPQSKRGRPARRGRPAADNQDEDATQAYEDEDGIIELKEDSPVKAETKRGRGRSKSKPEPQVEPATVPKGRRAQQGKAAKIIDTTEQDDDLAATQALEHGEPDVETAPVLIGKGKGKGKGKGRASKVSEPVDDQATQAYTANTDDTPSLSEVMSPAEASDDEKTFVTLESQSAKRRGKSATKKAIKSEAKVQSQDETDDSKAEATETIVENPKPVRKGRGRPSVLQPIKEIKTEVEVAPKGKRGRGRPSTVAAKAADVSVQDIEVVKTAPRGRGRPSKASVDSLPEESVAVEAKSSVENKEVPKAKKGRGRPSRVTNDSIVEQPASSSRGRSGRTMVKTEPASDSESIPDLNKSSSQKGTKRKAPAQEEEDLPKSGRSSRKTNVSPATTNSKLRKVDLKQEVNDFEEPSIPPPIRKSRCDQARDKSNVESQTRNTRGSRTRSNDSDISNTSSVSSSSRSRRKNNQTDQSVLDDSMRSVSPRGGRGRGKKNVETSVENPVVSGRSGRGRQASGQIPEDSQPKGKGAKRGRKTENVNSSQTESEASSTSSTKRRKVSLSPPSTPARNTAAGDATVNSPSLRRRTLETRPRVMFTGVVDNKGEKIVTSLGGTLVTSIYECTILVTDKVRRTVKFLCGLAKGLPIVTTVWLDRCKDAGMFIDANPFLVKDKSSEKTFKFSLVTSSKKAAEQNMLEGYQVHVTKSVLPDAKQMKDIIQCAGGEFLAQIPVIAKDKTVIVSCPKDKAVCKAAEKTGIPIVTSEFLLTGVLQQSVDTKKFRL